MPDRACAGSAPSFPSDPAAARPGLAWLLVLATLTLFGWLAADASVQAFGGGWNLALFLFLFPLPYLGALLLLMVAGALGAWPSTLARSIIATASVTLLAPLQAALVTVGFVVGFGLTMSIGLLGVVAAFPESAVPVFGLLAVFATCALMGGAFGAGLFKARRRLGLFAATQWRGWRLVDIGASALAGAFAMPAGLLLRNLMLPDAADTANDLPLRLLGAGAVIVAVFAPHALVSWRLMHHSCLPTRIPWVGIAAYAVLLYLTPALLSADSVHRPELGWPHVQLEARRADLRAAAERTGWAGALQAERAIAPDRRLSWNGVSWSAPVGTRLEGEWSPLDARYVALTLSLAATHPLYDLGVRIVQVREGPFRPVEIALAGQQRQAGYYETCRRQALHGLTVCWALGSRHARELSERLGEVPDVERVRIIDRLPYGDFVAGSEQAGFAASCKLEGACGAAFGHVSGQVRVPMPLAQLRQWPSLRREIAALLEEASDQPVDAAPGLVWRPPPEN
jgi:hypothetical protein